MIINYSRVHTWRNCKRKYLMRWIKKLNDFVPDQNTNNGSAIHEALPVFTKTKDVQLAKQAYIQRFKEYKDSPYLTIEAKKEAEATERLGLATIELYAKSWKDDFELVLPEYENIVPLLDGKHSLAFKTDGVIIINRQMWLIERKTLSAKVPINSYLNLWSLEQQATAYLLGVKKATGLAPVGFILEILRKTVVPEIIREPFLRTDNQLNQLEKELYQVCEEIERAESSSHHQDTSLVYYKTTSSGSCQEYFKQCAYQACCLDERVVTQPGEFELAEDDYVALATKQQKA